MKKNFVGLLTVIAFTLNLWWLLSIVIADVLGKLVEERTNGYC